jgi:hypothetical protein
MGYADLRAGSGPASPELGSASAAERAPWRRGVCTVGAPEGPLGACAAVAGQCEDENGPGSRSDACRCQSLQRGVRMQEHDGFAAARRVASISSVTLALQERFHGVHDDRTVTRDSALHCGPCGVAVGFPERSLDEGLARYAAKKGYLPQVSPDNARLLGPLVERYLAGGYGRFVLDFECPGCGAPCAPIFEWEGRQHHGVYVVVALVEAATWPSPSGAHAVGLPPEDAPAPRVPEPSRARMILASLAEPIDAAPASGERTSGGRGEFGPRGELRLESFEVSFPANVIGGALFLLLGVAAAFSLVAQLTGDEKVSGEGLVAAVMLTVAFLALGMLTAFSRYSAVVDGDSRRVAVAWGKPRPLWQRSYSLDDFSCVRVIARRRDVRKVGHPAWTVKIYLAGDGRRVLLAVRTAYESDGADLLVERVCELTAHPRLDL